MKFKYIGPHRLELDDEGKEVRVPVNCYNGEKVFHGDVVELSPWLSKKAANNPNYERVKPKKRIEKKEEKEQEDLPLTD